jgi:hypothetical protein
MSLLEIWCQFIKIGVTAFGGLGVTLSLIEPIWSPIGLSLRRMRLPRA